MKLLHFSIFLCAIFLFTSCKSYIQKLLTDNPEILVEVIKKNPEKVLLALNEASTELRKSQMKKQIEIRKSQRSSEFKNPKKPIISKSRAIFGSKKAPITIVKYSDFQCGYCGRSVSTVDRILKEYKGKVRVVYKHLPLDYHRQAYLAAQYYESVVKMNKRKAKSFYKKLFKNQSQLSKGAVVLDKLVKEVGLSPKKVKRHFKSVRKIIDKDIAEARKYNFNGTPAFVVGGVTLKGAQPFSEFKAIIDQHIKEKNI